MANEPVSISEALDIGVRGHQQIQLWRLEAVLFNDYGLHLLMENYE